MDDPLGWLFALAAIGPALYDALPSCAGARKAARKAAMPLLGGTKPAEVPPEPVPKSVLNTIEWTKGYGHIISGHPHCGVLTNDGGVMIVGDCANYYQDENGGDVGTGKHWPRSLIRAILVTKVSKDGDEEWSYRYDNGVGRNYVRSPISSRRRCRPLLPSERKLRSNSSA